MILCDPPLHCLFAFFFVYISSQLFVYIFQATMELQGEITRGQMVIEKRSFLEDASKKHNVDIIKSIETEKMKQLFMSAFGKKAAK